MPPPTLNSEEPFLPWYLFFGFPVLDWQRCAQ